MSDLWPAPRPTDPVDRVVSLPGSKSLTNRALVLAAIADGPSVVRRPLRSRDTLLMAAALTSLGTGIEDTDSGDWAITPAAWDRDADVDCGLAGTVMRFVPPVVGLADGTVRFDGDPHMRLRPVGQMLTALGALGVRVDDGGRGALPFTVHGTGSVPGGTVTIDASASSQFVSALLLAGARYDHGVDVRHVGKPVPSLPHIEMTVQMLRAARGRGRRRRRQPLGGRPRAGPRPSTTTIEPDLSNAAPFLALAAATGGRVTVRDWPAATTQPGDELREILTLMGCEVSLTDGDLTVVGPPRLTGVDLDLHDVGELTPAVAALCALADSPSHLRGRRAHPRPRDRPLTALATELGRLGADVTEREDGLTIRPATLHGGTFRTYADHRMAHAGVILGARGRRRAGRGRRDHVEDLPRLRRRVEPGRRGLERVGASRRPDGATPSTTTSTTSARAGAPARAPRTGPPTTTPSTAVVVTVDRGRFTLLVDGAPVMAMKSRPLGRKGVVVGDRVRVVGDTSGADGSLARIVEVVERTTTLRRTADDDDPVERVIVSNADQLVVVTALADPEPRPRLIDRALVAAYDAGMAPLLCLTKADLADPETLLSTYRSLGVPWVVTQLGEGAGDLTELRDRLRGRTSVLVGHSGRRQVDPGQRARPRRRPRGRHRQRRDRPRPAHLDQRLPPRAPGDDGRGDGWIIDTPGIRSFGLAHVQPEDLIEAFPDLDEMTETARAAAPTAPTSPSAGSTRRSRPARPTPTASSRSGACSRRARPRRRLVSSAPDGC